MSTERQYEYRIRYKQKGSVNTCYHYYSALTAEQALDFHGQQGKNKGWDIELLAIEEKNPYSLKWEDRSEALASE
jgi:hypothetical protein